MKNEIVKVNAADFGLEESKAQEIEALFTPMLVKMADLEKEYNKVIKLEVTEETCDKAKELRLQYVKVRTGTAAIHKDAKAFYLAGGRFVDGWKNAQVFASQGIEDKLQEIEKHFENAERDRLQAIYETRKAEILPFVEDQAMIAGDIGRMEDAVWIPYLQSVKESFKLRRDAEEKAEADRIAKEKADAAEQERIRKDNIRLEKEAKAREDKEEFKRKRRERRNAELRHFIIFIRDYGKMLSLPEAEYKKEFADIKIGAEQHYEQKRKKQRKEAADKAAMQEKQRKERESIESILRAERKEKERIESELREKKASEEKALKDAAAATKKAAAAAAAPDKEKLEKLAQDIDNFKLPDLATKESDLIINNVRGLLNKVTTYIRDKSMEI